MALPTWKAKGTFTSGAAALSVPWPTSGTYAIGDFALLFVHSANETIATPSGWTQVPNSPQSTGTAAAAGGVRLAVFYKFAASTTEANVSVADSGSTNAAQIHAFGDVHATDMFNATAGSVQAATTAMSFPGVTTTLSNCLIVHGCAQDTDAASTTTSGTPTNANLGTLTERHDETVIAGAGGGLVILTGTKASPGATGNTTSTGSTSVTHAYVTLALRSASDIYLEPGVRTVAITKYAPERGEKFVAPGVGSVKATSGADARGYALGSTSSAFYVDMVTGVYAALSVSADAGRIGAASAGVGETGYMLGGGGTTGSTSAWRFPFGTETIASMGATLVSAQGHASPAESVDAIYLAGGYSSSALVATTQKVAVATETGATVSATLQTSRETTSVKSDSHGYFIKGSGNDQLTDKLAFSTDTYTTPSLTYASTGTGYGLVIGNSKGYVANSNSSTVNTLTYSTDTLGTTTGTLAGNNFSSGEQLTSSTSKNGVYHKRYFDSPSYYQYWIDGATDAVSSQVQTLTVDTSGRGNMTRRYGITLPSVQVTAATGIDVGNAAPTLTGQVPEAVTTNIGGDTGIPVQQAVAMVTGSAPSLKFDVVATTQTGAASFSGATPTIQQAGPFYTTFYFLNENRNAPGGKKAKGNSQGSSNSTETITATANLIAPGDTQLCLASWITGPSTSAVSLNGDWSFQFTVQESSAAADATFGVAVTIVDVNGDLDFGRSFNVVGTSEIGTAYGSYPLSITISSGLSLAVGERINFTPYIGRVAGQVVEAGESATFQYGGTSTYAASVTYPTGMVFDVERLAALPGIDAISVSGVAPESVITNYSFAVDVGARVLSASGYVTVASIQTVTQPAQRAIVSAGLVPSAKTDFIIGTAQRQIALAGQSPTALTNHIVSPAQYAATVARYAPSVATEFAIPARSAILSGLQPTALSGYIAQPSQQAIALSGLAPQISVSYAVQPGIASLSLSAQSPVAFAQHFSYPVERALSVAGLQPAVSQAVQSATGTGAMAAQGLAPTLLAQDSHYIDVPAFALVVAGQSVAAGTTSEARAIPNEGVVAVTGYAPAVGQSYTVAVAEQQIGVAGAAPVAFRQHIVQPGIYAVTVVGQAATKVADSRVSPAVSALVAIGQPPARLDSVAIPAASVVLAGLVPAVAASDHHYITTGQGASAIAGTSPTAATGDNHYPAPNQGVASYSGLAPTLFIQYMIGTGQGAAALSGLFPVVAATQTIIVAPSAAAVSLGGLVATVSATQGATASPAEVAAAFTGHAPTLGVTQSYVINVDSAALSATGETPSLPLLDIDYTFQIGAGVLLSPEFFGSGYVVSGEDNIGPVASISGLSFTDEALAVVSATLSSALTYATGVYSSASGYTVGGYADGSALTGAAHKLSYSTLTASVLSATVTPARDAAAGFQTATEGFVAGGATGTVIDTIETLSFGSETFSVESSVLAQASISTAIQSQNAAYMGCKETVSTKPTSVTKFLFATRAVSQIAGTISVGRAYAAGLSGQDVGVFAGGYTTVPVTAIDVLTYSSEAVAASASALPAASESSADVSNSARYGYVVGGLDTTSSAMNTVARYAFATDVASALSSTLATPSWGATGLSHKQDQLRPSTAVTNYVAIGIAVGPYSAAALGYVPSTAIVDVSNWVDEFPVNGAVQHAGYAPALRFNHVARPDLAFMRTTGTVPVSFSFEYVYRAAEIAAAVASGHVPLLSFGALVAAPVGGLSSAGFAPVSLATLSYWIGIAPGAALVRSVPFALTYYGPNAELGELFVSRQKKATHYSKVDAALHTTKVRKSVVVSVDSANMLVNHNG